MRPVAALKLRLVSTLLRAQPSRPFRDPGGLGQQLLEAGILDFQLLQAPDFLGIHAAVLGTPLVERGLAEDALPADLLDRQARFSLLQGSR